MKAKVPIFGGPHDGSSALIDHSVEVGKPVGIGHERYLFVMTNGSPRLQWQPWKERDE